MPPWLLWTFLAVLCWGAWAVVSKVIGDALTPAQSQALSTAGILPVLFFLVRSTVGQRPAAPARVGRIYALAAGLLTCLGNIAYYALLKNAKAATVVPLTAVYPVVTVVLAVLLLRERLVSVQYVGIVLSFLAIYLFNVQTNLGMSAAALTIVLIPIATWGVAALFQKIATNHISGETATAWFLAAFVPVGVAILWFEPLAGLPVPRVWLLAGALGLTFAVGNLALLFAFARDGKASVITPLAGLYPVVSIPLAILIFGERIGSREALAIACALAGIVAVSWPSPEPRVAKVAI